MAETVGFEPTDRLITDQTISSAAFLAFLSDCQQSSAVPNGP